jgi:hypothetical protein
MSKHILSAVLLLLLFLLQFRVLTVLSEYVANNDCEDNIEEHDLSHKKKVKFRDSVYTVSLL